MVMAKYCVLPLVSTLTYNNELLLKFSLISSPFLQTLDDAPLHSSRRVEALK